MTRALIGVSFLCAWILLYNYHVSFEFQLCDNDTWEAGCDERRTTIP